MLTHWAGRGGKHIAEVAARPLEQVQRCRHMNILAVLASLRLAHEHAHVLLRVRARCHRWREIERQCGRGRTTAAATGARVSTAAAGTGAATLQNRPCRRRHPQTEYEPAACIRGDRGRHAPGPSPNLRASCPLLQPFVCTCRNSNLSIGGPSASPSRDRRHTVPTYTLVLLLHAEETTIVAKIS